MICECQQWLITLNKFKRKANMISYSKTPMTAAPWSQLHCCVLSSRLIFHSQSEWGTRWTSISVVIEDWLSLVCSTWNKGILPNELKPFITEPCRASITALSPPEGLTQKTWPASSTSFQTSPKQQNNDEKNHSSWKKKIHFKMQTVPLYAGSCFVPFWHTPVQKEGSKLKALCSAF